MQPDGANSSNYELLTTVPPSSVIPTVQQAIGNVNKEIPLEFHTVSEQVDDSLVRERLLATLSYFFGALALLLAMIGLYGATFRIKVVFSRATTGTDIRSSAPLTI